MEFALHDLSQQVMAARAACRPVFIRGGATKRFYGELDTLNGSPSYAELDMSGYTGIVNYQPSELVITARAGTRLSEIEQQLAQHHQMLAFEPPRFGPASTWGGCIAAGLSGPRRMAAGSLRDFVLGASLLDSSGTVLQFGGEVMKNVAGYDVSRLLAGSLGIFGALLQVSVKVVPRPLQELTLQLQVDETTALGYFNQWRGLPLPISATAWCKPDEHQDGVLSVRLSGSQPAIDSGRARLGGQAMDAGEAVALWDAMRDQTHPFFSVRPMWRVAVPPATPPLNAGPCLIEWNGGQRWLSNIPPNIDIRALVAGLGGHATLYRYDAKSPGVPVFHPLSPVLLTVSRRLKQELDPLGVFNPKRMFTEF